MKIRFLCLNVLAAFACVMTGACAFDEYFDEYKDVKAEILNKNTGITAGVVRDNIVLSRGKERQVISSIVSVSGIELFSCDGAPVIFAQVEETGNSVPTILKIDLPEFNRKLKEYNFRTIEPKAVLDGRVAEVIRILKASPDGNSLGVIYRIAGSSERGRGMYYPGEQKILPVPGN